MASDVVLLFRRGDQWRQDFIVPESIDLDGATLAGLIRWQPYRAPVATIELTTGNSPDKTGLKLATVEGVTSVTMRVEEAANIEVPLGRLSSLQIWGDKNGDRTTLVEAKVEVVKEGDPLPEQGAQAIALTQAAVTIITEALTLKADIESPAFTGDPTVPTKPATVNDTSPATMEALHRETNKNGFRYEAAGDRATTDDTTELTNMVTAAKTATRLSTTEGLMDGLGREFRVSGRIDMTASRSYGLQLRDFYLNFDGGQDVGLDLMDTRESTVDGLVTSGAIADPPDVHVLYARRSDARVADDNVMRRLASYGHAAVANLVNFCSENFTLDRAAIVNESRDPDALCLVDQGSAAFYTPTTGAVAPSTGRESNILKTYRDQELRRADAISNTSVDFQNTNPMHVVIACNLNNMPNEGERFTAEQATGMTEINERMFRVKNRTYDNGTGIGEFDCEEETSFGSGVYQDVDATGYGDYTGGVRLNFTTGGCVGLADVSSLKFERIYCVGYWASAVRVKWTDTGVQPDLRDVWFDRFHTEGVPLSMFHFETGTNVGRWRGGGFTSHNSHAKRSIISSDASGVGGWLFEDLTISMSSLYATPEVGFVDDPLKYGAKGCSFRYPDYATFQDPMGFALGWRDNEVVLDHAVLRRRLYRDPPAHSQVEDDFTGFALDTAKWGVLQGSSPAGTPWEIDDASLSSPSPSDGALRLNTGAASGAAAGLTQIITRRQFSANRHDLQADAVLCPNNLGQCIFVGFTDRGYAEGAEIPFDISAGSIVANATDGFGLLYHPSGPTGNWRMVGVKAGVLGVSRDLGFGPTANKKEWLSVQCTNAGAVQAYRNGERVGLRSGAMVTASTQLALTACNYPTTSTSRILRLDYIRGRQRREIADVVTLV
jgi:hypothetical protein